MEKTSDKQGGMIEERIHGEMLVLHVLDASMGDARARGRGAMGIGERRGLLGSGVAEETLEGCQAVEIVWKEVEEFGGEWE